MLVSLLAAALSVGAPDPTQSASADRPDASAEEKDCRRRMNGGYYFRPKLCLTSSQWSAFFKLQLAEKERRLWGDPTPIGPAQFHPDTASATMPYTPAVSGISGIN